MANGNYKEIWSEAISQIHEKYKSQNQESEFNLWFVNLEYIEDSENIITVSAPSKFLWAQVNSKGYVSEIIQKIEELTGQKNIELNYLEKEIPSNPEPETPPKKQKKVETQKTETTTEAEKKEKKNHPQLREDFSFETFVPGENNNFAYNAALAIAKEPGKNQRYNPLLLYGGSGLGKTHLMQAIGNYIHKNNEQSLKICCISAEDFTNEFTTSLSSKTPEKFKSKYRNLDVLLIDDIHFLQNKKGTQEELFHTFEALIQKKSQMVFTCDRPIKELKDFNDRMQNRLSSGICIDMNPPNYETRIAILKKKLEIQNKKIPDEVIDFIAKNVETNVRDLESALNKIVGYAEIILKPLTVEIAQDQLSDIFSTPSAGAISIDTIQKVVAEFYNISVSDLKNKKKDKKTVVPRQIAVYLCRELTEYSFMEIGQEFGGRDHSTIMHSNTKISEQIKTDSTLAQKIQMLEKEIKDYKK